MPHPEVTPCLPSSLGLHMVCSMELESTVTTSGTEDIRPEGLRGATMYPFIPGFFGVIGLKHWQKHGDKTGPLLPNRKSQMTEVSHKQKPEGDADKRSYLDGCWWFVCWVTAPPSPVAQWLVT